MSATEFCEKSSGFGPIAQDSPARSFLTQNTAYMFIDDFPMLIFNSYVTVNHVTENYQTAFFLMAVHIPADWQKSDPL